MEDNRSNLYEHVGKNIKKIRRKRKIGQEELANIISLSRSSISNIEIGKHQASIYTIYEIAIALDCELTEILPSADHFKNSITIGEQYVDRYNDYRKDLGIKSIEILNKILNDEK